MAARARPVEEEAPQPADDIAALVREVEDNPAVVLTDKDKFKRYYAHVEQEALAVDPDVSTKAGQDRIKTAAYAIARKKTAIDNAGKDLTETWRRQTQAVNAARNVVKQHFEDLRDRVRKPLTDFEEREAARKVEADRIIDELKAASMVRADETSADIQQRLDRIRGINLNDEVLGLRTEMATDMRDEAVAALSSALGRIRMAEEERAELERLRQAERDRIAREQQEQAEKDAREAEQRRTQEAADKARHEAEEEAERARQEELGRIEREKQAEIDAANERARKAEEEAQAERDRAAKEKADREAEEKRAAEEKAQREADQAHRTAVMKAAKEAIMTCGADEDTARKIVLAIKANEIPAVTISF